jgi:hypothetical protein
MPSNMKRKVEIERRTRPDGTMETVEYFWYECAKGHKNTGDSGICYDCLHQSNQANPKRVHDFYAKYGLNK